MKNRYFGFLSLLFVTFVSAQVSIGKTSIEGTSTILDFENSAGNTKGIILPAVSSVPIGLTPENNGTLLFDNSDSKVKMYENNTWVDLTATGKQVTINTSPESATNGVIIGNEATNAVGVLILESPDKAMILPRIEDPHLNVKSPYSGMICFDTKSKSLAVFDGLVWHYWK